MTPLPTNIKQLASDGTPLSDPSLYRSLVGNLSFLTNTRPNHSYSVQTLYEFMKSSTDLHFAAFKHTLSYVSQSVGQGIILQGETQLNLPAFSDSYWASCVDTRRSITRYLIMLGKSHVSWKSKKQSTISTPSSEREYIAMAYKITWLVRLVADFGIPKLQSITLLCDNNQFAIHISKNRIFHERTKHIEIDCHFTKDKVLEGLIELSYLLTKLQLADILTKSLQLSSRNSFPN